MSTASDGRRREHQVRDDLVAHGWTFIMRAAGSKGPGDLLLGHPEYGGALIQVGSKSKRLGPADRVRLLDSAEMIGALALLAIVIPRQGISYFEVSRGLPQTWARWEHERGRSGTLDGIAEVSTPGSDATGVPRPATRRDGW